MSFVVRILAEESGLGLNDIRRILMSAPKRYKTFFIPKMSGGVREISQPAREVKLLQRIFVSKFLSQLPTHSCATAYKVGTSILANAQPHAGVGRPILKMDFSNFFPSIKEADWVTYCTTNQVGFTDEDIDLSSRLLFKSFSNLRGLRLAIGAPSSPQLSNLLMFDFDRRIHDFAMVERVTYTRYADDLTFSASRTGFLTHIIKTVKKQIKEMTYPRLEINEEKTIYATSRYNRTVTGLILSNEGTVTIGREKKRALHAAVHHALNGDLDHIERQRLAGMIAYVNSVEPAFLDTLRRKYGKDIIIDIQKTKWLPRKADFTSS